MNFSPHNYQAYAIDYIETHPIAAVLLDMGLGKTVISLTAIADLLFDSFEAHRILVVAPLRVARGNCKMGAPAASDLRRLRGDTEGTTHGAFVRSRHHHH